MDKVVFREGDYAIIQSDRIFGTGFNCYHATEPGGENFEKINDRLSYFATFEAASNWLKEFRER